MGTLQSKEKITNDTKFPGGEQRGCGGRYKCTMIFLHIFWRVFRYKFQNFEMFFPEKPIFLEVWRFLWIFFFFGGGGGGGGGHL